MLLMLVRCTRFVVRLRDLHRATVTWADRCYISRNFMTLNRPHDKSQANWQLCMATVIKWLINPLRYDGLNVIKDSDRIELHRAHSISVSLFLPRVMRFDMTLYWRCIVQRHNVLSIVQSAFSSRHCSTVSGGNVYLVQLSKRSIANGGYIIITGIK
jgi:hypothetical protein